MRLLVTLALAPWFASAVQADVSFSGVNNSGTTQITSFNGGGQSLKGVVLVLIGSDDAPITGTIAPVYDSAGAAVSFGAAAATVTEGGGENGEVRLFFLGSGIPSTAGVTIDFGGGSAGIGHAFGYTSGGGDTELQDVETINTLSTSPSATLTLNGVVSAAGIAFMSGEAIVASTSPLSGWTSFGETDAGATIFGRYHYDTVDSSDVTAGWTNNNSEDAVAIAWAVSEVAGGGSSIAPIAMHLRRQMQ